MVRHHLVARGPPVTRARYLVGDVHEALATLPEGSVDLVLTSLLCGTVSACPKHYRSPEDGSKKSKSPPMAAGYGLPLPTATDTASSRYQGRTGKFMSVLTSGHTNTSLGLYVRVMWSCTTAMFRGALTRTTWTRGLLSTTTVTRSGRAAEPRSGATPLTGHDKLTARTVTLSPARTCGSIPRQDTGAAANVLRTGLGRRITAPSERGW